MRQVEEGKQTLHSYKNQCITLENSMAVLKKLNITMRPGNSTSRYITKRIENVCLHKNCTWTFTAASFNNSQKENNFNVSKPKVVHPHNGILCSHMKERRLIQATPWMKLEDIMYTPRRQGWRRSAHLWPLCRLSVGDQELPVGWMKGQVSSPSISPLWYVDWMPGQWGGPASNSESHHLWPSAIHASCRHFHPHNVLHPVGAQ